MLKIYRTRVAGEKRGKRIGFPTLNFPLKKADKIKRGVWLVKLKAGKNSYFGVANAGRAQTFGGKEEKIEVHILSRGFEKPAAGINKAGLHFLKYLRKTRRFHKVSELKKQIKKDIKNALCFLELSEKKEK